jgi:hypothetical protein
MNEQCFCGLWFSTQGEPSPMDERVQQEHPPCDDCGRRGCEVPLGTPETAEEIAS